jgi:hypothetical protein
VAIVVALLGVIGLVLGTYGVREAMRTDTAPNPGAASVAPEESQGQPAPAGPLTQAQPTQPQPAPEQQQQTPEQPQTETQTQAEQPAPEQTTTEDQPEDVFVVPTDYVGKSGSAAAATAEEKGLRPRVVDPDGNEIDSDQQSDCEVTEIDPSAGFVSPGSNLELTCKGSG